MIWGSSKTGEKWEANFDKRMNLKVSGKLKEYKQGGRNETRKQVLIFWKRK